MGVYKVFFDGGYAIMHTDDVIRIPLDCAGRKRKPEELEMDLCSEKVLNLSHVYISVGHRMCGPSVYYDKLCINEVIDWWEYINVADSVCYSFEKYWSN